MRPVAGYYRVSLARDNMKAPELYEDEIERYCSYKNLNLARIYSDVDFSAFRGAKPRPSLEELVADRAGYSQIIIPKLSRFGRSMKQLIRLFEIFDSDGIPLVFLDMNLDTSTSQGRLLRHILAAFAEYESDVKADYTRANHRRIRAEGRPWGLAPFGYRRGTLPATWVLDERAAPVVRGVFDDYAAGRSTHSIARSLNGAGIDTPKKRRWTAQRIGKVLDNPAYAGLSLVDDDLVTAQWTAIVPRELWDRVRARRLADPRRKGNLGRPRPRNPYLLSGLMWCGLCGSKMTHTTTTRDHRGVYHCGGPSWESWKGCLNMRVHGDLVELEVSRRFVDRCAFTILTETGERAGSPTTLWEEASLDERKRLLALVIEKIVMTPSGTEIPRTQYRTTLRHDIDIHWRSEVADRDDIAVVTSKPRKTEPRAVSGGRSESFRKVESAIARQPPPVREYTSAGIPSPRGKSWAEFQRECTKHRQL